MKAFADDDPITVSGFIVGMKPDWETWFLDEKPEPEYYVWVDDGKGGQILSLERKFIRPRVLRRMA